MRAEINNWWKRAEKDLDTAEFNLKGKRYEAAAFFSQQAAEKALKALYIKKHKKIEKVHDLVMLARGLGLPGELIELCKELSPAYLYSRYPDVVAIKNIKSVSKKLLGHARKVVGWVEEQL